MEESEDDIRICSNCGAEMSSGYCIGNGHKYYCSDACLRTYCTEEEWDEIYDNGNSDSYWTEWE